MPSARRARALRAGATLLAVCCGYFARVSEAAACSCVEPGSVREELAGSGSVFEGKVLELRHDASQHRLTARLSVLRRWKGATAKQLDVVTVDQGSLCGFGFERGKSYLLFTSEAEGTLSVSLCSRSQASELAASDFAELDRLAAAGAAVPAPSASIPPAATGARAPDAASASPPPAPAPAAPQPEPSKVAPEPRRGCGGCSSHPSRLSFGPAIAIALALGASARRRSRPRSA